MVGVEVARGLEAAAAAGLVHRDVKPANLLVDRRAGIKILDLGIVRVHGDETQPRADGVDVILGTLDYLAPEQAENSSAVDPRADLYALGATLYFLLAGHPPFPGTDIRHKLAAKQYSDPPPIHRVRPDVEVALSEIVQKMMARDPAARHQSAAEVVAALTPFAQLSSAFPARLFRPDRPSTVNDDYPLPAAESSSLPATVRMLKPSPRPLPPLPPLATPEAATDELLKAPTAVEMPPLPAELIATQPAKPLAAVAVAEPLVQPVRQLWPWLLLAALSFSAILAAVLALR
jgi:serine/threonine-protein kinase